MRKLFEAISGGLGREYSGSLVSSQGVFGVLEFNEIVNEGRSKFIYNFENFTCYVVLSF